MLARGREGEGLGGEERLLARGREEGRRDVSEGERRRRSCTRRRLIVHRCLEDSKVQRGKYRVFYVIYVVFI